MTQSVWGSLLGQKAGGEGEELGGQRRTFSRVTKGVSVDEEEDIHYKRAGEKRRDSKIDRRPTETLQKY